MASDMIHVSVTLDGHDPHCIEPKHIQTDWNWACFHETQHKYPYSGRD